MALGSAVALHLGLPSQALSKARGKIMTKQVPAACGKYEQTPSKS